jgi:hypothetical protein
MFQRGIEGLARAHPDIEFTVASPDGVVIEGVSYAA